MLARSREGFTNLFEIYPQILRRQSSQLAANNNLDRGQRSGCGVTERSIPRPKGVYAIYVCDWEMLDFMAPTPVAPALT